MPFICAHNRSDCNFRWQRTRHVSARQLAKTATINQSNQYTQLNGRRDFFWHNKQRHHVRKPRQSHEAAKINAHRTFSENASILVGFFFLVPIRSLCAKPARTATTNRTCTMFARRLHRIGETEYKKAKNPGKKNVFNENIEYDSGRDICKP